MLISLAFFMVAWGALTFENRQAMAIHSARLAAAAADAMTSSSDTSTTDFDAVESALSTSERRMGTSSGKQTPVQDPEKFTGKLKEVNTGCFSDGECYIVVDSKHVTVLWGWTEETVGSIRNEEGGIGELEKHIGSSTMVYANKLSDGTYTLYGNAEYYVELMK